MSECLRVSGYTHAQFLSMCIEGVMQLELLNQGRGEREFFFFHIYGGKLVYLVAELLAESLSPNTASYCQGSLSPFPRLSFNFIVEKGRNCF